jgi:hypothetical protein
VKETGRRIKQIWDKYGFDVKVAPPEDITMMQLRKAEEKRKRIDEARRRLAERGEIELDPETGEKVPEDAEEAEAQDRPERDLTGDQNTGFINQFKSRTIPGIYNNYQNIKNGYWTTNYLLNLNLNSNQRKELDSIMDQLARAAHPDDPQKQQAYKVRLGQEISDMWDSNTPATDLIAREQAKYNVNLKQQPIHISQYAQPPADMAKLREKNAKHLAQVQKDIGKFYSNHPEYQLPADWDSLTEDEREVKYPGIYWGENIFSNALNSVASIGTYLAVAGVTKNHGLATLLSGMVLYPQFVEEIDQELRALEKNEGIKVPDELRAQLDLLGSIPNSMIEGLGERLGFGPALTEKFAGNMTKKALKRAIVQKLKAALKNKAVKALAKPAAFLAKEFVGGGLEESTQQIVINEIAKSVGSERDLLDGWWRNFKVGGTIEAFLGAGPKLATVGYGEARKAVAKRRISAAQKQIDRIIKDFEDETAEDVLLDADLNNEKTEEIRKAAAEKPFTGAESIEGEEVAAEFTPEELEAKAGKEVRSDSQKREQIPGEKPQRQEPIEAVIEKGGEETPGAGGILQEAERQIPDVTIERPAKRKIYQDFANKIADRVGAKIKFEKVVKQDGERIGMQLVIDSGPAEGQRFALSNRAHKTVGDAIRYVNSVIKPFAEAGGPAPVPAPMAGKKPNLQKQYDDLVASLTPEQKASVLDLIKDEKMPLREKLGLMQADLAAFAMKQAATPKAPPVAPPPETPASGLTPLPTPAGARKAAPGGREEITQAIVSKYGEKAAGTRALGASLRKAVGKKAWDKMSPQEQEAETRAYIKRDIAGIPADMKATGHKTIGEYAIDRALDPLDPMNEFYAELLRRHGYKVEAGKTVGPPPGKERPITVEPIKGKRLSSRWTKAEKAMSGEPAYTLDGATLDDAQAGIVEDKVEGGSMFELVDPSGASMGMYKDLASAAKAAEDRFEPAEEIPPKLPAGGLRRAPVRTVPSGKSAAKKTIPAGGRRIAPKRTVPAAPETARTRKPGLSITAIITPQNPEGHEARYELAEADSLIPSHNPSTWQKRENYPEGVQERAYHSDTAEQAKVIAHAQKLDPRILLSDDPTPTSGPPIVTEQDYVISGNSRAMSIELAFKDPKKLNRYKNQLIARAAQFGLAPKAIRAMNKPVLIRRIQTTDADQMRALAREFNETMTQGMGEAAETASMGKAISQATIEKIGGRLADRQISLRELLGKKDALDILGWMIDDGAISATQKNKYLTKDAGLLNKRGKEIIELAIFGNILDDLDLIESSQKSHLNKIEKALAPLAKVKGRGGKWDITDDLKEGLRLATAAQARDLSIRDYLAQKPLFGEGPKYSKTAQGLAELLLSDKPTKFKERWANYATDAVADSKTQVQMFKPKSQPESLKEHLVSKLGRPKLRQGQPRPTIILNATIINIIQRDPRWRASFQ